jgi:hypothetical protein
MSFLYPRTVTITRSNAQTGFGAIGYGGVTKANETLIAANLPASIQLQKSRGGQEAGLPADTSKVYWKVLIPLAAAAKGLIQARDIVTDDLGERYQVAAPYWNSLGHNLLCERLEA